MAKPPFIESPVQADYRLALASRRTKRIRSGQESYRQSTPTAVTNERHLHTCYRSAIYLDVEIKKFAGYEEEH